MISLAMGAEALAPVAPVLHRTGRQATCRLIGRGVGDKPGLILTLFRRLRRAGFAGDIDARDLRGQTRFRDERLPPTPTRTSDERLF